MCGILGLFSFSRLPELQELLRRGVTTLHHRGPDDKGEQWISISNGFLGLGHTRLAIIDLSPGGHQPMNSIDGRYTIVFNGEIYNYRELRAELAAKGYVCRTQSDTEVLLSAWAEWGVDCLPRLRGMFAFAVFDSLAKTVTCVRDAFGIKPLFWSMSDDGFCFASEMPAMLRLLPSKPTLNLQRAYNYLVYSRYDNQEASFYNGIHHLMPGHHLTFHLEASVRVDSSRWWWPSIEERTDITFEQAADQIREMFLDNVRLHLRSDVSIGAALSGGVDSSALVCAMRYLERDMPIHAFTFVAPGSEINEERWADLVVANVGAIHHKAYISHQDLGNDLDDMIATQGEPFGSTSIYAQYRVFQLAREKGIIVSLDGQGADELLAGYHAYQYPNARLLSMMERGLYEDALHFLSAWPKWPGRSRPQLLMHLARLCTPSALRNFAYRAVGRGPQPAWLKRQAMVDAGVVMDPPSDSPRSDSARGRRLVEVLRADLSGGRLMSLLRHGDRNSMRWSIESRVPFLTTDLAEFVLRLPEEYVLSPEGETKRLFRRAMRGIVPDAILDRHDKIGFATPERDWLVNLRPQIKSWLAGAEELAFLDAALCRAEINAIIDGQRHFSCQSWRLICFCRWMRTVDISG